MVLFLCKNVAWMKCVHYHCTMNNTHTTTTMENFKVIDAAKAANVEAVCVQKNGRYTNVQITFKNGTYIESDGEHGTNDFAHMGIQLIF